MIDGVAGTEVFWTLDCFLDKFGFVKKCY